MQTVTLGELGALREAKIQFPLSAPVAYYIEELLRYRMRLECTARLPQGHHAEKSIAYDVFTFEARETGKWVGVPSERVSVDAWLGGRVAGGVLSLLCPEHHMSTYVSGLLSALVVNTIMSLHTLSDALLLHILSCLFFL